MAFISRHHTMNPDAQLVDSLTKDLLLLLNYAEYSESPVDDIKKHTAQFMSTLDVGDKEENKNTPTITTFDRNVTRWIRIELLKPIFPWFVDGGKRLNYDEMKKDFLEFSEMFIELVRSKGNKITEDDIAVQYLLFLWRKLNFVAAIFKIDNERSENFFDILDEIRQTSISISRPPPYNILPSKLLKLLPTLFNALEFEVIS